MPDGIKLKDRKDEHVFQTFLQVVKDRTTDDLEIMASLHYLKTMKSNTMSDEDIKDRIVMKQKRFTKEGVEKIWKEMKKYNLI